MASTSMWSQAESGKVNLTSSTRVVGEVEMVRARVIGDGPVEEDEAVAVETVLVAVGIDVATAGATAGAGAIVGAGAADISIDVGATGEAALAWGEECNG
jgi:hypothetical protein